MNYLNLKNEKKNIIHEDVKHLVKDAIKLDKDEEYQLINEYQQTGEQTILDKLVNSKMLLIVKTASYYSNMADINELIGEGVFGVITAINRFDLKKDVRLSTYASSWIRKYMLILVEKEVKYSTTHTELHYSYDEEDITNLNEAEEYEAKMLEFNDKCKYLTPLEETIYRQTWGINTNKISVLNIIKRLKITRKQYRQALDSANSKLQDVYL